ncbi:hypothetical protein C1H46_027740 [Malus baccata]|uniref:non-specific serine/threonine protein kinase n=1 Tax=Malus baccata TaxID=106549 RepID=A0A540LJR8_MALBA|nr:hypothetical protein C1H46_027740 [Malus baccata]
MSKPSLRLQFTKLLVFYHVLLWQLGHWPQSKLHCRADVARLPEDEVSALRAFMNNTELRPEQIIKVTYCSDVDRNYGFFIQCNCTNESECRITGIRMSNLGLTGTIHESVGNLTSLTYLIPDTIGNLKNLQVLYLQYNCLSQRIPRSFGSLMNLTELDLSENQLYGPLPKSLGKLKHLTTFYVSANYLSGEFPKGYDQLTSLKKFSIAGNYISGPLPVKTIAKWTDIRTLVLLGNNFEGNLTKEIFGLQNLQYLLISDLANNSFQLPPKMANSANFASLTLRNCSITGPIPKYIGEEMTSLRYLDLSFNKLTGGLPQYMNSNMIYMMDPFEMKNRYCPENKPKYHSLFINCGGEETTVLGNKYDQDNATSPFYTSPKENWAYSRSGSFGVPERNTSNYIKSMTCGLPITEAPLYEKARLSPVSLKYYAFCLREGNYTVTLYFNEIVYTKKADYTSLRKRVFDVYIQDVRRLNYFKIRVKEGSAEKPLTVNISAVVVNDSGLLNIHLYWPGKGSYQYHPSFNGPLISAISVTPEFKISSDKNNGQRVALITIGSIVAALLLLLAFAWRMGWLSSKELPKIKIGQEKIGDNHQDKFVTVKELIDATGNFSNKKKLGCSKTFFMAKLQGHTVAVKRLDSAHFKEKIDKLKKEIGIIESLQHNNILKLLDVYIGKDLQFLVYEYMENQSLEDILFVPSNLKLSSLKLEWETRFNICLGIAQGLQYLHEHERAYQANRKGNLKSLVDKSLSAYDQREALTILRLAVECTSMGTSVRPPMSGVVSVLLGKKSIDEVCPPAKPTGDVNVVGSTTSGKLTSVASTSSHST